MKPNTGVMIDGYLVEVEVKNKEGVYYAQADSFFLVACTGDSLDECLGRLVEIYRRIREVIIQSLLNKYGIQNPKI